jgi:UDP-N-acetylglucosamine 2-epimerase
VKILTVVGARPQFVKMAPVSRALRSRHTEYVVHTGQHYDDSLSGGFFRDLEIAEPDLNLAVGSGSHAEQTGAAMIGIERAIAAQRPDLVLVFGDTNSTLAGALAAAKLRVPLAHVEAGLRSFNRAMPEEINRVLTDHCSDLLFAPTRTAVEHLGREGIERGVHWVGDVMYDTALALSASADGRLQDLAASHGLARKAFYLATVHRAENTDDRARLGAIFKALMSTGLPVLLPLHPRTEKMLRSHNLWDRVQASDDLKTIGSVGYLDMLALERGAKAILTDSGGVQKEGYFAGTPVVTLREETEWPETVDAGWNQLAGADTARILAALARTKPGRPIADYGDGTAARRIAEAIDGWAAVSADRRH